MDVQLTRLAQTEPSVAVSRKLEQIAEERLVGSQVDVKPCKIPPATKSAYHIVLSPNGKYAASAHGDHNVYVCEVSSGKLVHCLTGHTRTPWALTYHPINSNLLATGCLAGEVRVWDLTTTKCEILMVEERSSIASLAFHPEGRVLAIATSDRLIFWDWTEKYPFAERRSPSHKERIRYVKFDSTGCFLYTGITNVGRSPRSISNCQIQPHPSLPYRCRELLRNRRELIQMRSDLTRRHAVLVNRYTQLLQRYRALQDEYRRNSTTDDSERISEEAAETIANIPTPATSAIAHERSDRRTLRIEDREIDLRDITGSDIVGPPWQASPRFRRHRPLWREWANQYDTFGFMSDEESTVRLGEAERAAADLRRLRTNEEVVNQLSSDRFSARAPPMELWELDMDRENLSRLTGEVEHLASRLRTFERQSAYDSTRTDVNSTLRGSLARIDIESLPTMTPQEIAERRTRLLAAAARVGSPPRIVRISPRSREPATSPTASEVEDMVHRRITSATAPTGTAALTRFESQLEPVLPQRPITWAQMMLENPQSDTADRRSIERREQPYIVYPQAAADNRINEQLQQRDQPSTSASAARSDEIDRPPLSPICLEGLQDAVAYARDITESSIEVFVRHHRESVARLQRSYLELSGSAQRLVRLFQATYDDMCRLQDEIDQRLGRQRDREASRDPARRLLNALIRMHDILLKNASDRPVVSEQHRLMYLRQESDTLLQVYRTVLDNLHGLEFPEGAVADLQSGRERLEQLMLFGNSIESQNSLDIARLQRTLVDEVHTFQLFVRAWKNMVLSRIQNGTFRLPSQSPEPETSSSSDSASTSRQSSSESSAGVPTPNNSESSGPATSLSLLSLKLNSSRRSSSTGESSSGMSQSTSSGSSRSYPIVRLSPMKRKFSDSNCSTPSDAISAEASSSSSNPPPANINLSPLRVTRLNSPRKSVVVSYNNFPFDVARSSTGTTDRVGESDEVSPRKRRKIDFSDGHEHAQPSSAMPTTSRERETAPVASEPELMTASEPEPMVREENSRVPEPTVGSDLHSSQIYRIRRCEQFQRPPEHNYAAPCRRDRNGNIIFGRSTVDETTLNNDFVLDFPPILRGRRETGGGRNGRDQASYGPFFSEDRANNNDIQDDHHWARWMSDRNASLSAPRARRGSPAYSLSRYGFSFHNRNQGRNLGEDRYAVPRLNDSSESSNPSNVRQQSQARIRRIVCLRDSLRRQLDRYSAPSNESLTDEPPLEPLAHSPLNEALMEVRSYMRTLDRERQELQREIAARPTISNSYARTAGLNSYFPSDNSTAEVFAWERPGPESFMSDGSLLSLEQETLQRRFVPRVRMVHDPEAEENSAGPSASNRRMGPGLQLPPPQPLPTPAQLPDDASFDDEDRESSYDIQRAINRAVAGDFIRHGDVAVANNILALTARMQQWAYRNDRIPDFRDATANLIVSRCKLHNDCSISISANGELMATYVESGEQRAPMNDTILQIVSLRPTDRGAVLWSKSFGPNAITVCISPSNDHLLVGLASRRNLRDPSHNQTFGNIFKLCTDGEDRCLKLVMTLDHIPADENEEPTFPGAAALGLTLRTISLNCALWLSTAGQGFIYASNKGNVYLVTPTGTKNIRTPTIGHRRGIFLRRNTSRGSANTIINFSDSSDSD